MKKKTYKVKRVGINFFNIIMIITAIVSGTLLIHDFVFWGIIPMFTGKFYQVTYFGLFLDFLAFILLELSWNSIKEW